MLPHIKGAFIIIVATMPCHEHQQWYCEGLGKIQAMVTPLHCCQRGRSHVSNWYTSGTCTDPRMFFLGKKTTTSKQNKEGKYSAIFLPLQRRGKSYCEAAITQSFHQTLQLCILTPRRIARNLIGPKCMKVNIYQ